MKAFAPVSLQRDLLPWWEAPWCFVLQESSELPGEISVESSRQTELDPPVAASCLNSGLAFKGQTWAASSCGETLPGFSWVCILQVVFYPLENFYRTRETSGNKIMAIYIPFLPLISLPKTRKLMNFNRKPHQWKSARTHTREKGFLLAKMRNTFGRIRIPANRRLWRLHCGGCNCEWPFHFGGQCAKLKAYRKAFNLG